ncbi:hypothetical protein OS242_15110 [Tumebacillus sp. DT12]|uniref:Spore cortex biosynthesis protein YabQ n=1 Tax=Tumebacillus lacus TaxID=2995335 RepID=A0ABT3X300_9BACL|nr:CBO0543 family protein [Tumebacillus lacus]MCX7571280.1 hypothetical protein [Tumebacillus lacus]
MILDEWVMVFFGLLSACMLIYVGLMRRQQLRVFYTVAISADFYSGIANIIGISYGFWQHPVRWFPSIFKTSIVYDLLFFPATVVLWIALMPKKRSWKIVYTLVYSVVLCLLEWLLERQTKLIDYGHGWAIYKTFLLYLMTYLIFYGLYRWLIKEPLYSRDK